MDLSNPFVSLYRRAGVVIFVLLLSVTAHAQITPRDDAYINTAAAGTNYGNAVTLGVISPSETAYVAFDLSSLPSGYTGSNIAKASLKLYVNAVTTAGSFNVDYVNGTWAEKTINANNAPALGTTIAASVPLVKTQVHDYIIIDVTAALQAWLNGTEPNYGIALVANSPLSASFDSKENSTQSHPPELDIVYSGSGGAITGVLTGANSGLTGGGTSGTLNLSLLTSCSSGQVLSWNGSAWACTALSGGGTVTSVGSGVGLTGGPITTSGTLSIDTTKVPLLAAANTFTNSQTVNGNVSATGWVSGAGFEIGSYFFDYGSYSNGNAFLGFAGNTTMTGNANTASGFEALFSDTTGIWNTASGNGALYSNTTGSYNTASGVGALGYNVAGNYNTAIGSDALWNNYASDNTAVGAWSLRYNTIGAENTAIGINALWYNSNGNRNTAVGSGALYSNSSSSDNTATGYFALYNDTGAGNTAMGSGALYANTTGNLNTVTGYNALKFNTTGGENNATGAGTMFNNTTGYQNTADGKEALWANTIGARNAAVGYRALYSNLYSDNTAIGFTALLNATSDGNTAIGSGALVNSTTGPGNTADGYNTLYTNTTGEFNAAFGAGALLSNTTGTFNTALGTWSDVGSGNLTNATAIGSQAYVTQSNSIVLGSIAGANGAPSNTNVGIGTTAPSHIFTIGQGFGAAYADAWVPYSSRRFKTNIQTLHGALAKVQQLRGVSYDLKKSGKHEIGVIAEEVGAVVPEVVTWEKNGKDAVGVDYDRLTALLIEATKEQQALIHQQQSEIARLTRQVKTIQATLKANGRGGSAVHMVKAEGTTVRQ